MSACRIDHVMSSAVLASGIFSDLLQRFAEHAPQGYVVRSAIRPEANASVYHFHRPQREWRLPPNSIVTVHHDLHDPESWLDLRRFLPRYAEAARVVCLNHGQKEILARHELTNTLVIPHGADLALTAQGRTKQPGGGKLRLGLFSRRYARGVKGEDRLYGLMERLDPDKVEFLFVGEDRHLDAARARDHGFACDVILFPPYRLFARIYQRVDVVLVLSHYEGGPASLPEALAAGTPVAATPVGMVPDWVDDGANGLILSGDPAHDAPRLMHLAEDGAALARLTAGARATVIPDWAEIMKRYFDLYAAVAGHAPGAPGPRALSA